ncbi:uncharacterized protein LOC110230884 [Arabidopsis lyrata subsp. lyrata]|uniref:uncharacterized protein LOC110230884 n=1 Tax=Arabidopsis lyrata subsp. lyrata TaxID=81972 RepID=UPI000A29A64C|nr:uncharacterized protein LOC110230884 [Arabidopsis lyrata subsp. lyrata]|eukprot:XP_020890755.1 uncharacterized protein LOC110230884 [Arabidopsis lyrata subsp. lyrata]
MVVETRAQELAQARKEKDVLVAEPVESRLNKLENKLDAQNLKIEGHIAEMFEAINMLSASKQSPPGVTRLGKLDFPRFGGEQVKDWIFKADQFFKVDHTPDDLKVSVASIHLDGIAATWHQNLVEDEETEGIKEYYAKFENIRTRVKFSEPYLVSAYLARLRLDTHMHIRMFKPKTVQQCLLLGRLYETAHPRKSIASPWTMNKQSNKSQLPFRKDAENHIPKAVLPKRPRDHQMQPRKFLSNEEMSARRAKGLCYFCDEQYTPEHYKVHRKAQLFVLDMEEGVEEVFLDAEEEHGEPEGEVAHISAHAMEGISTYSTMRVKGIHHTQNTGHKRSLFMLVDSGSTHNFMDPQIAAKLGCSLMSSENARVRVADVYN